MTDPVEAAMVTVFKSGLSYGLAELRLNLKTKRVTADAQKVAEALRRLMHRGQVIQVPGGRYQLKDES